MSSGERASARKKRVLIVDDHPAIRRGLRLLIETRRTFEVVAEAGTGHEAIEETRRTQPHIAIVDYLLPGLNGVDLTLMLKRERREMDVLIYTMHSAEDLITSVLRAGARAFVSKSDPEDRLLTALESLAAGMPYFSGEVAEKLLDHFLQSGSDLHVSALTLREREIVQLIAEGKTSKRIADLLGISAKTVETHRATAMRKLNARSVVELVRYALRNNLAAP